MMVADCGPQIHLAAYHAKAEDSYGVAYNNDTPGIGVLCELANNTRITAGTYFNSYRRQSNYAAIVWQPVHFGNVKVGVLGGAVTGYRKDAGMAIPMAAFAASVPVEKIELHVAVIPETPGVSPMTAEFSFSFKFK